MRVLSWFSAGCPSAVATKLALARYDDIEVVRIDVGSEHPDNERFTRDCEEWFGVPIKILKSDKYANVDEVIEGEKYLVGQKGAPCSVWLKKKVREAYQRPTDLHVWGYSKEEVDRFELFSQGDPGLQSVCPLIEADMTEDECIALVERAGIKPPVMYELGYPHNNCIGCVKGGMGYFNMIRRDFPLVFLKRSQQERDIGFSFCSEEREGHGRKKFPVWLDELDPDRGDIKSEARAMACSLNCAAVEAEVAPEEVA